MNDHDDEPTTEAPAMTNAQLAQEWAVLWGVREIFEPQPRDEEDDDGDRR